MILTCYTIGHSKHTTEQFANLIKPNGIDMVIDVRSIPYSRHAPQFNRTVIKQKLYQLDLEYEYMGDVIGGKFINSEFLSKDGYIDFYKVIKNESFKNGIDTVIEKIKNGLSIVLMCAEKDPLYCHRFLLISRELNNQGIRIIHIMADGSVIGNDEFLINTAISIKQNDVMQMDLLTDVKNTDEDKIYQMLMMKKIKKKK